MAAIRDLTSYSPRPIGSKTIRNRFYQCACNARAPIIPAGTWPTRGIKARSLGCGQYRAVLDSPRMHDTLRSRPRIWIRATCHLAQW